MDDKKSYPSFFPKVKKESNRIDIDFSQNKYQVESLHQFKDPKRPIYPYTAMEEIEYNQMDRELADDMMAAAANRLGEVGGGVSIWKDGEEIALVKLPIAGLMSDSPAAEVAASADRMVAAMAECGCTLNNAYMQHSLLALVVIPSLRISDLGLVDVDKFEITELFEDNA